MGNGKGIEAAPVLISVAQISIRDDRLRAVDESAVAALKNDMAANELTQAIEVRALKGGHRLEAVMRLEWLDVSAVT